MKRFWHIKIYIRHRWIYELEEIMMQVYVMMWLDKAIIHTCWIFLHICIYIYFCSFSCVTTLTRHKKILEFTSRIFRNIIINFIYTTMFARVLKRFRIFFFRDATTGFMPVLHYVSAHSSALVHLHWHAYYRLFLGASARITLHLITIDLVGKLHPAILRSGIPGKRACNH